MGGCMSLSIFGGDVNVDFGKKVASNEADVAMKLLKQGRCPSCGIQTHKLRFGRNPKSLTVSGKVDNGRCIDPKCNTQTAIQPQQRQTPLDSPVTPTSSAKSGVATVRDISESINASLVKLDGHYTEYRCTDISWEDVSRGESSSGTLSCWGPNITDTRLKTKDNTQLFTVRPDNWNEKLSVVSSDEIAIIVGNHKHANVLTPVTLTNVLKNMGEYGEPEGLDAGSVLENPALDKTVSIRFQTTFLPPTNYRIRSRESREIIEFTPEVFNYNTKDDSYPRNLLLLCTTQGMAVQADGCGPKRLFHHFVPSNFDQERMVGRYWLEAERTDHKVGGAQVESKAEREDALLRSKATASVIGTKSMGTRFNALMTVQVPLRQTSTIELKFFYSRVSSLCFAKGNMEVPLSQTVHHFKLAIMKSPQMAGCVIERLMINGKECRIDTATLSSYFHDEFFVADIQICKKGEEGIYGNGGEERRKGTGPNLPILEGAGPSLPGRRVVGAGPSLPDWQEGSKTNKKMTSTANAARVSLGSKYDDWGGLKNGKVFRHPSERITVTVVLYNMIQSSVPTTEEVKEAIDDLESLYKSCSGLTGNLAQSEFDFFKNGGKIAPVMGHDVFPTA